MVLVAEFVYNVARFTQKLQKGSRAGDESIPPDINLWKGKKLPVLPGKPKVIKGAADNQFSSRSYRRA
jgi:hypothetical protein